MDKINFKADNLLYKCLFAVVLLFLIALTILVSVDIANKIRQGQYIGQNIENKSTITVSGEGEIYSKPDLALIDFSVRTEDKTVSGAMNTNSSKMNGVIEAMKKEGINKKDLKTTSFNIYPQYEYVKSKETEQIYPYGKRVLVGYDVNQSLEVKIRDLSKVGQIIQKATDSGANEVSNIRFTIENKDELKKQAREQAIKEAKSKAKDLASQLGVKLVKIIGFSENANQPVYYNRNIAKGAAGSESNETPQIETGENKIVVDVSIVYEIN